MEHKIKTSIHTWKFNDLITKNYTLHTMSEACRLSWFEEACYESCKKDTRMNQILARYYRDFSLPALMWAFRHGCSLGCSHWCSHGCRHGCRYGCRHGCSQYRATSAWPFLRSLTTYKHWLRRPIHWNRMVSVFNLPVRQLRLPSFPHSPGPQPCK